jgi:predicted nucleic acid-binding protein
MPVSNSSPLIHMSRLGKLGYAREVFQSIMIPPAVRSETIDAGRRDGYGDAILLERLSEDGWLRTTELSAASKNLAAELSAVVGTGEAEAIALAVERSERLFIDDLKGRRTAAFYKIETTTTLGLIFELLIHGVLTKTDYRQNVKNYGSQGWISGDILQEFLERGDEVD